MLTVVGWLWRDPACTAQYSPEHANVWARMIHRHLQKTPHRFVLMTDTPAERFDDLITPVELWPDWRQLRHPKWPPEKPQCYVRLKAFSEDVRPIFGDRFVSIDLDCVVIADLDPLFDRAEDFLICHRHETLQKPKRNPYQASMWCMRTAARRHVWDDFKGEASVEQARGFIGSDQAWIQYRLGPDEAGWTAKDGVISWGSILADNRYLYEPPPGVRIIFFNGTEKPEDFRGADSPAARSRNPGRSHLWVGKFYV